MVDCVWGVGWQCLVSPKIQRAHDSRHSPTPGYLLLPDRLPVCAWGCAPEGSDDGKGDFSIDYEKYQLDNGLDVVLHQDSYDPMVAVAILYHLGSNQEKPGITGLAHFFEHMLFQNSEHLGKGNFTKKVNELGGSFNGGTSNDFTVYFEVVPRDALEKILWMESARMGFFINIEVEAVKPLVEKYFGEIDAGPEVQSIPPRIPQLDRAGDPVSLPCPLPIPSLPPAAQATSGTPYAWCAKTTSPLMMGLAVLRRGCHQASLRSCHYTRISANSNTRKKAGIPQLKSSPDHQNFHPDSCWL